MNRVLQVCMLLALAGCPHYMKLDPKTISALDVMPSEDPQSGRICARGGLIDVAATTKDGKRILEGSSNQVSETEFDPALVDLTASIGTVHERSWNPPNEAAATLDATVKVTATLHANPSVTKTVELHPHWACEPPVALIGGGDGAEGYGGGQNADDQRGTDGPPGDGGGNAGTATIEVGYVPHGDARLVAVYINATGVGEFLYFLDPSITMRVSATGGAGGGGGYGMSGGNAGGDYGRGADGGRGGDGGDGGTGGVVTVYYDAASPELAKYVAVDVSGGKGGIGGTGGNGGNPGVKGGDAGEGGPAGRDGRDGGPGQLAVVAQPGINEALAKFTTGHEAKPALPEPRVATATKPGGKKKGAADPVPPPRAPTGRKPPAYASDDGARVYIGELQLDIVEPHRPKEHHHGRIEVISTRTQKHHFTIKVGETCTLPFHRPPGESRHIYELDTTTKCETGAVEMTISKAKLELDTAHDKLNVSFSGAASTKCTKPKCKPESGTIYYQLAADRR
jgi:hypothetical protein